MSFFRSRGWVVGRRVVLVVIVLAAAYRNYGDTIAGWLGQPAPGIDIVLTHVEFRADLVNDQRPAWFIGLSNRSRNTAYRNIVLEATYSNEAGVLEQGEIVIDERLNPGQETLIGSRDPEARAGATRGSQRVVDAEAVE